MENLSSKEVDTLIEALEAWEDKDFGGELMGGLMEAMFMDKMDDAGKEKIKAEGLARKEKRDAEKKMRKETSLLLKAKLVMMKRDAAVESLISR